MNVAVIGASADPERYSYLAIELLNRKGHRVFPVHPRLPEIQGLKVYAALRELPEPVDTITLYVNSKISQKMGPEILTASPRRIIFNPGAENPELARLAAEKGIEAVEACTLVMLKTGQF
jgi:predicted CoA-binding protein